MQRKERKLRQLGSSAGRIRQAALQAAENHTEMTRDVIQDLQTRFPIVESVLAGLLGTFIGLAITATSLEVTAPGLILTLIALAFAHRWRGGRSKLLTTASVSPMEMHFALEQAMTRVKNQTATFAKREQLAETRRLWLVTLHVIQGRAQEFIDKAVSQEAATVNEAEAVCNDILTELVQARTKLLRFDPEDETFNFHIFRWDSEQQLLVTLARQHGADVVVHNRTWAKGSGHVGTAFERGELLMLDDLQGSRGEGYRAHAENLDKSLYRSIVDAPITFARSNSGVLTISSGRPQQFRKSDAPPIMILSGVIGTVFAVSELDPKRGSAYDHGGD